MSDQPTSQTGMSTMKCPHCGYEGPTIPNKRLSTGGWILFAVLVVFCIIACWLPFVLDGCKEDVRKCGSCGKKIA